MGIGLIKYIIKYSNKKHEIIKKYANNNEMYKKIINISTEMLN